MSKTTLTRLLVSYPDNPRALQPTIEKPTRRRKLVVLFAIAFTFVFGGAVATAQQPTKIRAFGSQFGLAFFCPYGTC